MKKVLFALLITASPLLICSIGCKKEAPAPTGTYTTIEQPTGQMNTPILLDMQYMDCMYQTCMTSVDLPLGDEEYMIGTFENIPPTGSRPQEAGCFYTFYSETHDTSNPWSMDYKFKDINCGTIEAGDTIVPIQVRYTSCGATQTLQEHEICTVTISGDTVSLYYHDCLLPLNGLNGTVNVTFVQ